MVLIYIMKLVLNYRHNFLPHYKILTLKLVIEKQLDIKHLITKIEKIISRRAFQRDQNQGYLVDLLQRSVIICQHFPCFGSHETIWGVFSFPGKLPHTSS